MHISTDLRVSGFTEAARAILQKYDKFLCIFLFKGHYINLYFDGDTCLFVDSGSLFSLRKGRGKARFRYAKCKEESKKDYLALKKYRDQYPEKSFDFSESHTPQINKTCYGRGMSEGNSRGVPDDSKNSQFVRIWFF